MNTKVNMLYASIASVKKQYPDEQLKVYPVLNPASTVNPIDEYFKQEAWNGVLDESVEARPFMMTLINDHRSDLIDRCGDSILQAKLKAYHRQFIQKRHNLAPDYKLVIDFLER